MPSSEPDSRRRAAALIIGNELLSGKIADANLPVLARTLRRLGVVLDRVVMVLDQLEVVSHEVRNLSNTRDVVFTSGGVGPTHDDVTVDAVAAAFGVGVVSSPVVESMLRAHYGDSITAGHLRMARIPEGARLVTTSAMPWPTVVMNNVWLLPGVPQIFAMKMPVVVSQLGGGTGFVSASLYTLLDEGLLKPHLDRIVAAHPKVEVGSYPKWRHPHYKTLVTFDGQDEAAVSAARDDMQASLPPDMVVEPPST